MRRVIICGAAGRDFHTFNTVFRDDPHVEVVAFTATQIPGIAGRVYPAELAGHRYPAGIPIIAEEHLDEWVVAHGIDEVVHAYSDVSHADVMHLASRALAAGASVRFEGPAATMLESVKPVVAVCAVRTGCGKSQVSRAVGSLLADAGLRVALVRHPMPYGDLVAMRAQRFATLDDLDAAEPTIEEREEYEPALADGLVVHAGVDYGEVLAAAEADADVIVWDGGNNDQPFFAPDLLIVVADPLRAGHELRYHPGEANLRMADVVLIGKTDVADPGDVERVAASVAAVNPGATIVRAASPVSLDTGPSLAGARVLVVEDGPTTTHGEMGYGAGLVAARDAGAVVEDPRRFAAGEVADTLARHPHLEHVLPAMGYSASQLADLRKTIENAAPDAVVAGTPIDLGRVLGAVAAPVRRARYSHADAGVPGLADVVAPVIACATEAIPRRAPRRT